MESFKYTSTTLCTTVTKKGSIFCDVYLLLLCLTFFNSSQILILQKIGDIAMYGMAILSVFYSIANLKKIDFKYKYLQLFILFCVYQIFAAMFNISLGAVTVLTQSLMIFTLMVFVSNENKDDIVKKINILLTFILMLAFIDYFINLRSGVLIIFTNPNKLGMIGFFSLLFNFILGKKHKLIWCLKLILSILIIILSSARTPLMCLIIMIFIYLFFHKKLADGKCKHLFVVISIIIFSFVTIYIYLSQIKFGIDINNFIYKFTGKNLFSGRQRIWSEFFKATGPFNLIFGYGSGVRLETILVNEQVSTHNQFIEIIMQYGFVGLIIFFAVLNAIWKSIIVSQNKNKGIFAVFFIGIIIYNVFEVMLIQNIFSISILSWIMFLLSQNNKKEGRLI